ncbi:hypothetical protein M0R45_009516 [Rubus argutus]|uniref:Phytocyanin domain-containing protein n=1 Tax=Rubus argutus TaxID=59490 RepID=A0AAW1Y4V2_RUBAR
MGSCRDMNMIACLSLMVMVGLVPMLMKGATAADYAVGDSLGWTLPPNTSFYSDWAASKTFRLGDILVFNSTGDHTVADGTKEEYDNCSSSGIIFGSPVNVNLTTAGSHYYFCTVGDHCKQGQKFTITVGSSSTISAPPPPPSGAHSIVASALLGLIISTLVICFFTYM